MVFTLTLQMSLMEVIPELSQMKPYPGARFDQQQNLSKLTQTRLLCFL